MTKDQFILLLVGHLAVLIHCLFNLKEQLDDARAANINFNAWKDYWKRDVLAIIISVSVVWLWYLLYPEVVGRYPAGSGLVRCLTAAVAFIGSYALQYALGRSKKMVRNVIDHKTNALDSLTGNTEKTDLPR